MGHFVRNTYAEIQSYLGESFSLSVKKFQTNANSKQLPIPNKCQFQTNLVHWIRI
jgi:hypothetical protein